MGDPVAEFKDVIAALDGVAWTNSGEFASDDGDEEQYRDGWVKIGLKKSENGWRALEFLAWATDDLQRSGYRVRFVPTSEPPYLNEPGECLAFVFEADLLAKGKTAAKAAGYLRKWVKEYWPTCRA